ncbi:MAG: hypothetical protein R2769_11985 [Saprospiraceae bacterium]
MGFQRFCKSFKGRILEDGEEAGYLDHIPPLFGKAAVSYEAKKFKLAYVFRFNGEKPAEEYGGGEDNLKCYSRWNLRLADSQFLQYLSFWERNFR